MHTKRTDALVPFKPCPRCGGLGQIPCNGMEYHRELHKQWASSLHLKPVLFKSPRMEQAKPGLALAEIMQGGWAWVKVYIAVTDKPPAVLILEKKGFTGDIQTLCELQNFDIINNKALWYDHCFWRDRENITILDSLPEALQEMRYLQEGFLALNRYPPEGER